MIGKVLGNRYKLCERLGGGGMAVVYKAEDTLLHRWVAVKVLRSQYSHDEDFVKRFQREAMAVASLSHPHIVNIYDVGQEEDLHYLVMEYVKGCTLKEIIRREGALRIFRALNFAQQICEALEHAHENEVIHRDIKPHNILVTPQDRVKVMDFGIAQHSAGATITFDNNMVGTVQYISPEQAKGEATSAATDIYSIGVVLFEMLTGEVPYKGDNLLSTVMKHVKEDTPSLRELRPSIPLALDRVVRKAMHKDPRKRFASARDLWEALEKIRCGELEEEEEEEEVLAAEGESTRFFPRFKDGENNEEVKKGAVQKKRTKSLKWLVVAVLLGLLLLAGYLGLQEFLIVEETQVPEVEGMALAEAAEKLRSAGLEPEVGDRRHHPEVEKDYVISQSVAGGEVVKRGIKIYLTVSEGPSMGSVPDVTGKTEMEARVQLANANFEIKEINRVYHPESSEGIVIGQDPQPAKEVPEGTGVSLIVSKGPKPREIPMPDLIGMQLEEAKKALENSRLQPGLITYEESLKYFEGQVMHQSVEPGEKILQGGKVDLVISKGEGPPPSPIRITNIEVPRDGKEHRVRIVVDDAKSIRDEYSNLHSPGDSVSTVINLYGNGTISIYVDEEKIKEKYIEVSEQ